MNKITVYILGAVFLAACSTSPVETVYHDFDFDGMEGVFVVNEGNYLFGNSSLTFLSTGQELVYNDIFILANDIPLGDVAQSMTIQGDTGWVVVNNSGRIYRIDVNTARISGEINGLVSPRNILLLGRNKAYISDLYEKALTVFDPEECTLTGKISLDNGEEGFNHHTAEQVLLINDEVFVNSWNYDNMLLVIDPLLDKVVDSIPVITQPNSMVEDSKGMLWVLCDGGFPGSPFSYEAPGLLRIDPVQRVLTRSYRFEEGTHPFSLEINKTGDTLYFINRDVWRMRIDDGQLPGEPFIKSPYTGYYQGGYYALGLDHENQYIYLSDAIDHLQRGVVYRFRPDGVAIDSFRAGINPGKFVFRTTTGSRKSAFP